MGFTDYLDKQNSSTTKRFTDVIDNKKSIDFSSLKTNPTISPLQSKTPIGRMVNDVTTKFNLLPDDVKNSNPVVGENLFLNNALPIHKNDNILAKAGKGAVNFVASVVSSPGELLRKGSIQTANVITGKGIDKNLPKNTSFIDNILPKKVGNAINTFANNHPVIGGLAKMGIEGVADPTSFIAPEAVATKLKGVTLADTARKSEHVLLKTQAPKINKIFNPPEIAATKEVVSDKLPEINKIKALPDDEVYKEITSNLEGVKIAPDETIKAIATDIKDRSGLTLNIKDVYRNFRDAFGKNFDYVKTKYLDPFDASKKAYTNEVKNYTDKVYNDVVKDLGFKKGSKESAAIQEFGEGVRVINGKEIPYTGADLIKEFGTETAAKIKNADGLFRQLYNEVIDKSNATRAQIYPNNSEKLIPKRKDYYRHFKEMAEGFQGLKNIFDTPAQIDPKLAGISEFTKPNSKWASFMQKRGNGEYEADAIGGFLNYIQPAAYSIHIDPHIANFRGLAKDISEATADTKNANNTIKWLSDFSNSLAGKTNKYDRLLQEDIPGGRTAFRAINWLNSRVKANQVLLNTRSAISQFANVPVSVAKIKNPVAMGKGVGQTLAGIVGKGNPAIKQSQFINERYMQDLLSRFNTGILQQPTKFASWIMEGADKLGANFTWNSAYNKAMSQGIKDPVKYADDLTRSIVAGRGIGEAPLLQQSKTFQLVAPFQLEVANLWHVMGDSVKEKDFGSIALILLGNYIFNNIMEDTTGSRVTFDPIDAMVDALNEKDVSVGKVAGRLAGEVLSNIPLGQTIAAQYPEYGADISTPLGKVSIPSRKQLFGEEDPTRFGSGILVTKAIADPLYKVLPPLGGAQIKKSIEGISSINKGMVEKNGKMSFPVDKNVGNIIKGGLFGQYATPEAREYFDKNRRPLSEEQTKTVTAQPDIRKSYNALMELRKIDTESQNIKDSKKLTDEEKRIKLKELQKPVKDLKKLLPTPIDVEIENIRNDYKLTEAQKKSRIDMLIKRKASGQKYMN